MNDRLPLEGVFPMHCSANVADDGRVAVFFGLSGTGKTTLSADPERRADRRRRARLGRRSGVFNIEGGCYAKVIRLSAAAEPEIFRTTHTFGTILENVAIDEQRRPRPRRRLEDREHARGVQARADRERAAVEAGRASVAVIFLTADAFGILPPIARLSREQALYFFLSGFTAKLAGTEIGVTEPQPTFSTCFGQPFLPQPPRVYAGMLGEKLDEHGATRLAREHRLDGRPVRRGQRMPIQATRAMLHAALSGRARRRRAAAPTRSSASRCRSPCPDVDARAARPALDLARPRAVRPSRHASWRELFADNFATRFADVDDCDSHRRAEALTRARRPGASRSSPSCR